MCAEAITKQFIDLCNRRKNFDGMRVETGERTSPCAPFRVTKKYA